MTNADKIRKMFKKGMTPMDIVRKLKCSAGEVYRLQPKKSAKKAKAKKVVEKMEPMSTTVVNTVQVGGAHYRNLIPQPWDVIAAWNLGYFDGNVVKYVARFRNKDGIEDLEKAKHYLDKLIEEEKNSRNRA